MSDLIMLRGGAYMAYKAQDVLALLWGALLSSIFIYKVQFKVVFSANFSPFSRHEMQVFAEQHVHFELRSSLCLDCKVAHVS